MVQIYVHDNDSKVDFRALHDSGKDVSLERLEKLGVFYKYCESQEEVETIRKQRSYKNRDEVFIRPESFPSIEAYEEKLEIFYKEHLHEDEEIRYILEGGGYFDIRDSTNEEWIRVKVMPGDLLILPPGVYHRFTVTEDNFCRAQRLFKDEPKWEAFNRPDADSLPIHKEYVSSLVA
ncbi:acireductone dioxygenase (Ni2+-requiring) Ecym_4462 [Eremothecium cymbalariae DBVPG|uniref:Acireductone dioxygenase n=1 Tax=Eremothecium cymbalariae (strain CBS 270.75 / DBVPG 7215 / KCTC 17166 / NRRL Y-17582) TaxID=931890 RepID=G8JU01_ERECY|nr:hypothetical protein Ecym_4462 [Eremothecium cymbalariae DBVPG\